MTDPPSLFFAIHRDLPREGPGSAASTRRALDLARPFLPPAPRVVDVACGPGAQTLVLLAELPGAEVTAFDLHAPFVDQLRRAVAGRPEAGRLAAGEADMRAWSPSGLVDLVWCEGAAYLMGVEAALARWGEWLRPGGVVAFSDAVWLTDRPSAAAVAFWAEYPAMRDRAGLERRVLAAGYRLLGSFVLPEADWWDAYYRPLEARLAALERRHPDHPELSAELTAHRREIEVFREHADEYGYLFVVAARG
ncbi:MAG: class I SAM-dependent methyltransferase [Sandaracinaceae bacterium]